MEFAAANIGWKPGFMLHILASRVCRIGPCDGATRIVGVWERAFISEIRYAWIRYAAYTSHLSIQSHPCIQPPSSMIDKIGL